MRSQLDPERLDDGAAALAAAPGAPAVPPLALPLGDGAKADAGTQITARVAAEASAAAMGTSRQASTAAAVLKPASSAGSRAASAAGSYAARRFE